MTFEFLNCKDEDKIAYVLVKDENNSWIYSS